MAGTAQRNPKNEPQGGQVPPPPRGTAPAPAPAGNDADAGGRRWLRAGLALLTIGAAVAAIGR